MKPTKKQLSKRQQRLLRTKSDEARSLSLEEARELVNLIIEGLKNLNQDDWYSHGFAVMLLEDMEDLDGEDAFGTEGWQRGIHGVD